MKSSSTTFVLALKSCKDQSPSKLPLFLNALENKFTSKIRILVPDQAAEWISDASDTLAWCHKNFAQWNITYDLNCIPDGARKKRLFLADMDSTMIEQECIDELADKVGLKEKVSAITERAMNGEIAFEPALRERVALLKGLPVTVIDDIIINHLTLSAGARTALATMRAHGTYTCLVSGGFTLFTSRIAEILGFDEHRSNTLVVENGILTGEVNEPILGKEAKRQTLIELRKKFDLTLQDTMAVGDGANDLAMLEEAGLGVAYHAKPAVARAAHTRIDVGDLTGLLTLQGYTQEEWV
jgi:phosphoserine phosphatase